MPLGFTLTKIIALVRCLCMLHNFFIDENQLFSERNSASDESSIVGEGRFSSSLAEDYSIISAPVKRRKVGHVANIRPESSLGGDDYFDDYSCKLTSIGQNADSLSRAAMLQQVQMFGHKCRPGINTKSTA